jgi:hypothetical protein
MSLSDCSSKRKSVITTGKNVLSKKPRAPATIVSAQSFKCATAAHAQALATAAGNENPLTGAKNPPLTTELKTRHFHVWSQVEVQFSIPRGIEFEPFRCRHAVFVHAGFQIFQTHRDFSRRQLCWLHHKANYHR